MSSMLQMGLGMEEEGQSWGNPGKQPPQLPTPNFFFKNNAKELPNGKQCKGSATWAQSCYLTKRNKQRQRKRVNFVLKQFEVHQQWRNKT